ncbi:acetyltransferase GCN5 [Frondihabitans sp. PAMC 28766]|uniref:GNAT family acetyltransferase n=1 Tax=Frondihabitans sp. PAMC 28766 TaxID=1795630 RepID=UPI00078B2356|nr:GNAT family acetyltransferase [Frondihabitans sp. PAMC 28766]AMM19097.1 acetyltransferase GCN5 [Frondihabitans sp. PAMC 28766]
MLIRPLAATEPELTAETEQVVALWEACGLTRPWNDPRKDIARKLRVQPELFLVGVDAAQDRIVATAMAGYDGHRGWVYYVAVDPALQGGGHGAAMMAEAERLLLELGCPKVNVQIRSGNDRVIGFYERLDYAPDGALGFGKRLIAD